MSIHGHTGNPAVGVHAVSRRVHSHGLEGELLCASECTPCRGVCTATVWKDELPCAWVLAQLACGGMWWQFCW